MKKILCLILVILLLLSMSGCQRDTTKLSNKLRKEICAFYTISETDESYIWCGDPDNRIGDYYYYGTYNGYAVLIWPGLLTMVTRLEIGDHIFKWGSQFHLLCYKDGAEYDLKDIYDSGEINDSQLSAIHESHKTFYSQFHNGLDHDYDG